MGSRPRTLGVPFVRLGALVLLAACTGASASSPAAMVPWDSMNRDQKMAYMKSTVAPRMKAIFMEYDPHKYPKMDCVPCHTSNRAVGWKMPNPDLALDPSCISGEASSIYGSEEAAAATAKMNAFMRERVQPAMAALLGRPSYDATTRKGFDCFGCHVAERPSVSLPTVPPNPNP